MKGSLWTVRNTLYMYGNNNNDIYTWGLVQYLYRWSDLSKKESVLQHSIPSIDHACQQQICVCN